jgi:hypothetical protein
MFLMLTHLFACGWLILHRYAFNEGMKTWVSKANMQDRDDQELFITSYYFTLTTMTTVGYGDFSPNNSFERIWCMVVMLIGVIVFAYISGSLSSILTNADADRD